MSYTAYAAQSPHTPLESYTYEPEPLGAHDVEIKITHCGICHSDVHIIDGDWGEKYPAVAGHEIVGTVTQIGDHVTGLQAGQRVGVGWQCGCCMKCEWCIGGETNQCVTPVNTCQGRHGGFADYIRVDGRFAFPIPDALASENAAPLLCGGITVYAPLREFDVNPSMRVGVIGIGGLGHLALQFASKFGCEVTAFSSSPDKEAEARSFGAYHFVNSRDESAIKAVRRSLDMIISTVNVSLDWRRYVQALRPKGNLVFVGAVDEPISIPVGYILGGRKSISGSNIGDRRTMIEMLDFAARHQVVAQTETVPFDQINAALDKVRNNQARYRMVLQMPG